MSAEARNHVCPICQQSRPQRDLVHGELIHGPVVDLIRQRHPTWSPADMVCLSCVNRLRADYVGKVLEDQRGELSALDEEVIRSLKEHELISENLNQEFQRELTLGARVADGVAEFGGSWRFIGIFAGTLLAWIGVNSVAYLTRPFDPYPYILLNLVLSCLAAIQAPVIMMSQNRQEAKDRLRAEHDYRVNLKAELEVRHLHWKLDRLLSHEWRRLLEIQQMQMDLMEELVHKPRQKRT